MADHALALASEPNRGVGGSTLRAILLYRLSSNPVTAVPLWSVWEFVVSSTNKCFMHPKTHPSISKKRGQVL